MRFPPAAWSRLVAAVRLRREPSPALPSPPPGPGPVRYPAAFCAPGTEAIAALTLWARGEHVAGIHGSRMLEGSSQVIVVAEPPDLILESRPALTASSGCWLPSPAILTAACPTPV